MNKHVAVEPIRRWFQMSDKNNWDETLAYVICQEAANFIYGSPLPMYTKKSIDRSIPELSEVND